MTTTTETQTVSQITGTMTFEFQGITFQPWLDDQRLAVIVNPPDQGNWQYGDLVHVGDAQDMRKVMDRRTRLHGDWREYALPVAPEPLLSLFTSDFERFGNIYNTGGGGLLISHTSYSWRSHGEKPGWILKTVSDGTARPAHLPDMQEQGWSYNRYYRVLSRRMEDFGAALAEALTSYWQGIVDSTTGPVVQPNGLVTATTVEWEEQEDEKQTVEVIEDGVKTVTVRTPVRPRLATHTYADKEFVEETARDYATRNSRISTLNEMLSGRTMTADDGSTFNWKRHLSTLTVDGTVYVSLESVEKAARAGQSHFGWCDVALQVVEACRQGKVMHRWFVQLTWSGVSSDEQPIESLRTKVYVEAWSQENAYRLGEAATKERLSALGFNHESGTLDRYHAGIA